MNRNQKLNFKLQTILPRQESSIEMTFKTLWNPFKTQPHTPSHPLDSLLPPRRPHPSRALPPNLHLPHLPHHPHLLPHTLHQLSPYRFSPPFSPYLTHSFPILYLFSRASDRFGSSIAVSSRSPPPTRCHRSRPRCPPAQRARSSNINRSPRKWW